VDFHFNKSFRQKVFLLETCSPGFTDGSNAAYRFSTSHDKVTFLLRICWWRGMPVRRDRSHVTWALLGIVSAHDYAYRPACDTIGLCRSRNIQLLDDITIRTLDLKSKNIRFVAGSDSYQKQVSIW